MESADEAPKSQYSLYFSLLAANWGWRRVRNRLRTPPSSLRKPHVSDTTPNRAFLRGFPATQFPDLGLCGRSRILLAVFGVPSLHLKFPFLATRLEREDRRTCTR